MTRAPAGAVPGVPSPDDRAQTDALRTALSAADFTVDGVEDLLGPVASAALHREEPTPALLATGALRAPAGEYPAGDHRPDGRAGADRGADPRATLIRLFVLGTPVTRAAVDAALPGVAAAGLIRLSLAEAAGEQPADQVRARVDLRPYQAVDGAGPVDWWIASDLGELATGGALRTDHVLGVGGASTTLAQVTVRDPRRRTLDLGTGCGIQALHASRHSDRVTATDISARALAFAGFNAALAGVPDGRLDLRAGSMLDPVAGEDFDLVVSNPPFVITPRGAAGMPQYEYRDGGRTGDAIVAELIAGVGRVLAPGGVAQLLGNWEVHGGAHWRERVGGWLDASGLDGWVIQRELQDPAQYAETWIRDGGTTPDRDPVAWRERYLAWLDDFAQREVTGVGFGIVVLHRPPAGSTGPRLRRMEEITGTVRQPLGPAVGAALSAHGWLAARDDGALASARLRVAPDVTEERYFRPGETDPQIVLLRQGGGLGRTVQAGTALAGFVGACDGELSAGQIIGALGALLDADADAVAAEVLPEVRGLVLDGLLLPL